MALVSYKYSVISRIKSELAFGTITCFIVSLLLLLDWINGVTGSSSLIAAIANLLPRSAGVRLLPRSIRSLLLPNSAELGQFTLVVVLLLPIGGPSSCFCFCLSEGQVPAALEGRTSVPASSSFYISASSSSFCISGFSAPASSSFYINAAGRKFKPNFYSLELFTRILTSRPNHLSFLSSLSFSTSVRLFFYFTPPPSGVR